MNFFSNVLNATPVVGHVKGLIHYAAGDKEGGHEAMYQSTRTSAVIAGGVIGGAVGGPAGAVGGALSGGSLTDSVASGAMGKPQGIVKDCVNVGTDIQQGRNPAVSLLVTGVHIGLDALGGLGLDGISSATANSVGEKIASNVGEEMIEKSVKITAEEVAKFSARKASEAVVKKNIEKTAESAAIQVFCLTAHIAERAALETIEEKKSKKNGETKTTKKVYRDKNTEKKKKREKEIDNKTSQSERYAETGSAQSERNAETGSAQSERNSETGSAQSERNAETGSAQSERNSETGSAQSERNAKAGSGSQPREEKKDNNENDGCNNPTNFPDLLKWSKEIIETICRKENPEFFYKYAVDRAKYGGCLTDSAASGAMSKLQGLVKGSGGISSATANNVGEKIASNVVEEILEKSVKIIAEEVAKFTARKASEAAQKKNIEKTAESATILALCVTTHIAERSVLETIEGEQARKNAEQKKGETKKTKKENSDKNTDEKKKREKQVGNKTSQSETNPVTGSGSQPPEEKRDNNQNNGCNNPTNFPKLLKLLKEIIETICRKENREKFYKVFETLTPGQRKSLVKLIKKLNYYGATEEILKLVIQIFDRYFPSDFTFVNFLSLIEFVKTYIANKIEEKCVISLGSEANSLTVKFNQLVAYLMKIIIGDVDILRKILDIFNDIRVKIESENTNEPVDPNFRDIFSAVYHYFKHRIVPGSTLSVNQYFEWIRDLLRKVKRLPEWSDLGDPQNPRNEIVYEFYVVAFGRRIKIVVKVQDGIIVLASCYVVYTAFADDEDGDMFIDGVRRRFMKK